MPAYAITQKEVDAIKREWWEKLSQKEKDRFMKAITKFEDKKTKSKQTNK